MTARDEAFREDFGEQLRILADVLPDELEHKRAELVQLVKDWLTKTITEHDDGAES